MCSFLLLQVCQHAFLQLAYHTRRGCHPFFLLFRPAQRHTLTILPPARAHSFPWLSKSHQHFTFSLYGLDGGFSPVRPFSFPPPFSLLTFLFHTHSLALIVALVALVALFAPVTARPTRHRRLSLTVVAPLVIPHLSHLIFPLPKSLKDIFCLFTRFSIHPVTLCLNTVYARRYGLSPRTTKRPLRFSLCLLPFPLPKDRHSPHVRLG